MPYGSSYNIIKSESRGEKECILSMLDWAIYAYLITRMIGTLDKVKWAFGEDVFMIFMIFVVNASNWMFNKSSSSRKICVLADIRHLTNLLFQQVFWHFLLIWIFRKSSLNSLSVELRLWKV